MAETGEVEDIHVHLNRIEQQQNEIMWALAKKKKIALAFDGDENEERGNWSGKLDFIVSSIGYAVGLGNVWRFPYLCYKNGGGAFLIPYCIFLFLVGIPLFLAELSLGQFSSSGPITMWKFAPIFRGIGVGMCLVSLLVSVYYNVIIAWAIYYLFASFRAVLPWTSCGEWSSIYCETKLHKVNESYCRNTATLAAYGNGTCYNTTSNTLYGIYNETVAKDNDIRTKTPANDYLDFVGLKVGDSPGFDDLGPLRWDMSLCLLLAWIIMFLCLSKGVKSSGKVVYFTAIFPYIILIILFINGLFQEGHTEGIDFYLKPNMTRLADAGVWKDAAAQIFFSLGVCWGGLATMASYNRFQTNTVRDTFIISLSNCLTSFFAGFVIFSYLGAFAHSRGKPVNEVVDSGVSLAFIVYPQAVTTLPVPTLWAILFFFMLILLGMDTQFALLETMVTGVTDAFPKLRRYKTVVILMFAVVLFFIGLVMATPGGIYVVQLMDDYSSGWNLMVLVVLLCIALLIYGLLRFARDIETMVGKTIFGCVPWRFFKWYFILCWGFISPALVTFTMVFSWIKYTPSKYGKYTFPTWVTAIGWVLTSMVVLCVVVGVVVYLVRTPGTLTERLKKGIRPTTRWGPALVKHRQLITYIDGFVIDPDNTDTYATGPGNNYEMKEVAGYDNAAMEKDARY